MNALSRLADTKPSPLLPLFIQTYHIKSATSHKINAGEANQQRTGLRGRQVGLTNCFNFLPLICGTIVNARDFQN